MNTQEFKEFCHNLFLKYGFTKVKNMYYLNCSELLCGIYLRRSIAMAYYVDVCFFIGEYSDKKAYPSFREDDFQINFTVPSKCEDCTGNYFMDGCIEFELYTQEEIEPYFIDTIEKYIIPLIKKGKKYVLENKDVYLKWVFKREMETVLNKLNA